MTETVGTIGPWRSFANVKSMHKGHGTGWDWFDEDVRSFYQTKFEPNEHTIIDGRFFITSDIWYVGDARTFTVWAVADDAAIVPVWERGHHGDFKSARKDLDVVLGLSVNGLLEVDRNRNKGTEPNA